MSSELLLILDDASGQFNYLGGQWTLSTLVEWYDSTSYYPAFAGDGIHFGSFNITFEGTSIAFIGNTPTLFAAESQSATVSIDGEQPYNITYGDPKPPSYMQWYKSPTLAEGSHTISVGQLDGTAVDFALISVGPQTSLSGKRIFVDDTNSAIQYSGQWSVNTDKFSAGTLPDGFPAGNSTHRSVTPGDTITFRFSGSSPSVYGIFSWANLGFLSANYTLDGNTLPGTFSVTPSTSQFVNNFGQASNVLMFSDDTIQPGDHTLVVTITQCVNQTFMLDYITYLPSFSTLATMPNLTSTSTSSANVSASTTLSTTASSQNNNVRNSKSTPTGAIAGGVVGGLVAIAILFLLLFWLRKRRGKENYTQNNLIPAQTQPVHVVPQMDQQPQLSSVRDFTATHSTMLSTNRTVSPFQSSIANHQGSGSAIDLKRERVDFGNQQRPRNLPALPITGVQGPQSDSSRSDTPYGDLDVRNFVESEPPSYDAVPANRMGRLHDVAD